MLPVFNILPKSMDSLSQLSIEQLAVLRENLRGLVFFEGDLYQIRHDIYATNGELMAMGGEVVKLSDRALHNAYFERNKSDSILLDFACVCKFDNRQAILDAFSIVDCEIKFREMWVNDNVTIPADIQAKLDHVRGISEMTDDEVWAQEKEIYAHGL